MSDQTRSILTRSPTIQEGSYPSTVYKANPNNPQKNTSRHQIILLRLKQAMDRQGTCDTPQKVFVGINPFHLYGEQILHHEWGCFQPPIVPLAGPPWVLRDAVYFKW